MATTERLVKRKDIKSINMGVFRIPAPVGSSRNRTIRHVALWVKMRDDETLCLDPTPLSETVIAYHQPERLGNGKEIAEQWNSYRNEIPLEKSQPLLIDGNFYLSLNMDQTQIVLIGAPFTPASGIRPVQFAPGIAVGCRSNNPAKLIWLGDMLLKSRLTEYLWIIDLIKNKSDK